MLIDPKPPQSLESAVAPSAATLHAPLLLGLLLGAIVSQDVAWPVAMRMTDSEWPHVPAIVAMGIAFGQLSLAGQLRAQHLDCHFTIQHHVDAFKDRAHTALTYLFSYFVAANRVTDHWGVTLQHSSNQRTQKTSSS